MIRFTSFAVAAILSASSAQAVVVVGQLYNTGLGTGGAALAAGNGKADANYKITAGNHPGVTLNAQALTYFNTAYFAEDADSRWISYASNGGGNTQAPGNTGFYDLTTTFDLTGFIAGTAKITGSWGVDNGGTILINGAATNFTLLGVNTQSFNTLRNFTIDSGFVTGLNTLTLRVTNQGGPTAGRFDNLVLSADVVPEPASWAMLIAGFGLVGAAARRRRGQPARALA